MTIVPANDPPARELEVHKLPNDPPAWELEAHELRELFACLAYYLIEIPKRRVGAEGDGGYICPDAFEDVDGVISVGIGGDASFDIFLPNAASRFINTTTPFPRPPRHILPSIFTSSHWRRKLRTGRLVFQTSLRAIFPEHETLYLNSISRAPNGRLLKIVRMICFSNSR
jgi:hypothetical protein